MTVAQAPACVAAPVPVQAAPVSAGPAGSPLLRQLFDADSSTYSYILGDVDTGEAVIIDPVLEQVDRDLQLLDELGLTLKYAINTHCHADHITGSGRIKALCPGVKSAISKASAAAADIHLQPGDALHFGAHSLLALATPGHTSGCVSYLYRPMGSGSPDSPSDGGSLSSSPSSGTGSSSVGAGARGWWVFTGDALLIRGCGRTDFQGGDAGLLYDSVHSQLFTLPHDTSVYPAHDYKGRTASSIGEERAHNPRLTRSREEFIALMANLGLAYPKRMDASVPANLRCGIDVDEA